MDTAFLVDTVALRAHLVIIREKQRNARIIIDQLNQALLCIQPELYSQCVSALHFVEDLLRYYFEQENLLIEMTARYESTHSAVGNMLEGATETVEYLF